MNSIYIYEGAFATGDQGFPLIRMAAAKHCLENGLPFDYEKSEIIRDEKGKPYFADLPLEFSLTHSGSLWMCLLADRPCGLDLQVMKECDHEKIAERFFLPEEAAYVRETGREGFFHIWVRKESYCKMTGEGFFGADMPCVLADQGEHDGKPFCFQEIEVSTDMKCAVCSTERLDPQLRILG